MKKPEKVIQINTFTYKDQDFDVLIDKQKVSYIFDIGDKRYGNAVKITGKRKQDIVIGVFNLLLNFVDTYETIKAK